MKGMFLFGFVFLTGCSASVNGVPSSDIDTLNASQKIKLHAEQALEQCGKGNAYKVNTEGFTCYEDK